MKKFFTKKEYEIMNVLWDQERPLSSADILERTEGLPQSTIQVVLRKLLKEKLIEVKNVTIHTKVATREFSPTLSREEYIGNLLGKGNSFRFAAQFIQKNEDKEELDRLEKMIQEKKEESLDGCTEV